MTDGPAPDWEPYSSMLSGERPEETERIVRLVEEEPPPEEYVPEEPSGVTVEGILRAERAAPMGLPAQPGDAAYIGPLGEMARAIAEGSEASSAAILATLLTGFGMLCGDYRWHRRANRHHANLYTLLIGTTGSRKGTADDAATEALALACPEYISLRRPGLASGQAIAGYYERHKDEHRLLLHEPEYGRILDLMEQKGSTLSTMLRNAYDGAPLGYERSREECRIDRHHTAMLGHITPPELRSKLRGRDAESGFLNRYLAVAVESSGIVTDPLDPSEVAARWAPEVADAVARAQSPGNVPMSDEALADWKALRRSEGNAPPRPRLHAAMTARYLTHALRLSLIYALSERTSVIESEHLAAAVEMADYGRRSVLWAIGDSTGNRDADALLDHLRNEAEGEVDWQDAKRVLGIRAAALSDAVDVLAESLTVTVEKVPRAGRPRRVIRLLTPPLSLSPFSPVSPTPNRTNEPNGIGGVG